MNVLFALRRLLPSCLITVAVFCVDSQAGDFGTWSRTISTEPANSADRAHRFALYDVDQGEFCLVGTWLYFNCAADGRIASSVVIEGAEADGSFWPDVRLEAKDKITGKWNVLGQSTHPGKRTTIAIEPNGINYDLKVKLDVFKHFVGKYTSGRIVLTSGEASEFDLRYLLPPDQSTNSKTTNSEKR